MQATKDEKYMQIVAVPRDDGFVFVRSPDVSYFSAIIEDSEAGWDLALDILRESLNCNEGAHWDVRYVDSFSGAGHTGPHKSVPAHVIAAMSA